VIDKIWAEGPKLRGFGMYHTYSQCLLRLSLATEAKIVAVTLLMIVIV